MIRIVVVKKHADWPNDTIIRFFRDGELLGSLIVPDGAVDDFRAALPVYPPAPVVEQATLPLGKGRIE